MWSRILSWLCACGLGAGMCASGWYRDAGWCCQPLVHTATNARSQPFSVCRASDNGANSQGQGFGKSINGGFIVVGCIWNIRRFQCCHRRELWCWFIFWGGLSLHVIHERAWRVLEAPKITASCLRWTAWTVANKPLVSIRFGLKFPVHPNMDHTNMDIGGRVHRKSSARKVTYPSIIPVWSGLTLEFPWDRVKSLGLSQPSVFGRFERLIFIFIFIFLISLLEFPLFFTWSRGLY